MLPMLKVMPDIPLLFISFEGYDRHRANRKPTKAGEVLQCNGFATRADHFRRGLGAHVAYHCMDRAKEAGFTVMQVETAHAGSDRVFGNPPAPHRAEVVLAIDPKTFEANVSSLGCGLCCAFRMVTCCTGLCCRPVDPWDTQPKPFQHIDLVKINRYWITL
jgi:hypothetical protein